MLLKSGWNIKTYLKTLKKNIPQIQMPRKDDFFVRLCVPQRHVTWEGGT